jgi:nucleoid-associated protein YgaU
MIELRTLAIAAALLLAACGDASDSSSNRTLTEVERDLARTTRNLEQSRSALRAARQSNAALLEEQQRDRRRVAELVTAGARAEHRNQELARQLARTRDQLARTASLNKTLGQQRSQDIRRIRALAADGQSLRGNLARAHDQIRRLQAHGSGDPRRAVQRRQRDAALSREVEELRRYNGFLLQERGNLQAWLQEANATRRNQQDALGRAEQEAERIRTAQSAADAANAKLGRSLDDAKRELSALRDSRDALTKELETLRVDAEQEAEAQRRRAEKLEEALARANAPAQPIESAPKDTPVRETANDAALRAELDAANGRIAKLRAAKSYLVEKIEACTDARRAHVEFLNHIARLSLVGAPLGVSGEPRLLRVANESADPSKSTRHEKELTAIRQKLKDLEQEREALQAKLEGVETELTTLRKQVETLTWANKELVKELDAAYASGKAGKPAQLPEGTRGMYVIQKGQSLSEVAKAFYGDPGRWRDLVESNKEKIPDPDMIEAGTVILIPD